jgi:hypothetical protein
MAVGSRAALDLSSSAAATFELRRRPLRGGAAAAPPDSGLIRGEGGREVTEVGGGGDEAVPVGACRSTTQLTRTFVTGS